MSDTGYDFESDLEAWAKSEEAARLMFEAAEEARQSVESFEEFIKLDDDILRLPVSI